MPRRKEIGAVSGPELYSLEVYAPGFFDAFDPQRSFEKWAAVRVSPGTPVPPGMETLAWEGGLYAVFLHKGPSSRARETYGYIFERWLPASGYRIDDRPHFAVMGEKYKKDAEDSEEEVWVPVRK